MNIDIEDDEGVDIAAHFEGVFLFIDEARKKDIGVVVHCAAGMKDWQIMGVIALKDSFDYKS